MAKKLQVQVPSPCHENGKKMTYAEEGRFCASCQKTVIDFSNMSGREISNGSSENSEIIHFN